MYKKCDTKTEIHLLCIHDLILHKIGLVRIVSSFPSVLYFVTDRFLKLMEGYVFLKKEEGNHFRRLSQCSISKDSHWNKWLIKHCSWTKHKPLAVCPGHSIVECTLTTHYPICHSKAHNIDQCEYNLLNKAATSVRRIEAQGEGIMIPIGHSMHNLESGAFHFRMYPQNTLSDLSLKGIYYRSVWV